VIDEINARKRAISHASMSNTTSRIISCGIPPAIYLNQRTTSATSPRQARHLSKNFTKLFNGILTPKQLEGLRLLVTAFPQQQFNLTEDRRSERRAAAQLASTAIRMAVLTRPRTLLPCPGGTPARRNRRYSNCKILDGLSARCETNSRWICTPRSVEVDDAMAGFPAGGRREQGAWPC